MISFWQWIRREPERMRYPGSLFFLGVVVSWVAACAPPPSYWSFPSFPPPARPSRPASAPPGPVVPEPAPAPSAKAPEPQGPLLTESEIKEQALATGLPRTVQPSAPAAPPELPPAEQLPAPAKALLKETTIRGKEQPVVTTPEVRENRLPETAPARPEKTSLLALIAPDTPPQRAASLRLAEEGRVLLQAGQFAKGLSRLEKAIALDSRNRYAYYFLADAHYHLAHYQQSLNFLEIVEPLMSDEPLWLARVYVLQGENYRALGFFERADKKYIGALALDPSNRIALDGLTRLPPEMVAPGR